MSRHRIVVREVQPEQAVVLWKAICSDYGSLSQPIDTPIMVMQGWSEFPGPDIHYDGTTEEVDAAIGFLESWAAGLKKARDAELAEHKARKAKEAKQRAQKSAGNKKKSKKPEGQMSLDGVEEPEPEETDWCSVCDGDKPVSQLQTVGKFGAKVCQGCRAELTGGDTVVSIKVDNASDAKIAIQADSTESTKNSAQKYYACIHWGICVWGIGLSPEEAAQDAFINVNEPWEDIVARNPDAETVPCTFALYELVRKGDGDLKPTRLPDGRADIPAPKAKGPAIEDESDVEEEEVCA